MISLGTNIAEQDLTLTISIHNCRFAYRCDRKWDELKPTTDDEVRFCGQCERTVHWCSTDRELAEAVALNHCVAIDVDHTISGGIEMGVVAPDR
jgi:hypothetical protein